jgi:hypothetical protein
MSTNALTARLQLGSQLLGVSVDLPVRYVVNKQVALYVQVVRGRLATVAGSTQHSTTRRRTVFTATPSAFLATPTPNSAVNYENTFFVHRRPSPPAAVAYFVACVAVACWARDWGRP